MSALTIQVHLGFAATERVWRQLQERSDCHAFQTYDWLSEWQACIGSAHGLAPQLVVVRGADDQPLMLLPLGIERRGLARVLTWLGGVITDYHGPLIARDCAPSLLTGPGFLDLWDRVVQRLPRFDYLHFDRQLGQICGYDNPFLVLGARPAASSAHLTRLQPDWDAYYQSKAASRTRRTQRRKTRKLASHGALALELPRNAPEVAEILDTMMDQKSASYHELGVRDLFADPGHRRFVSRLTTRCPELTHLCCLRVGDRIAATHWGLLYRGHFYSLLPTYERGELAALSPGVELRLRLMARCCEEGVETFDFTLGDEPYKDRWCEVTLPVYQVLAPSSAWGRVVVQTQRARAQLKREVKNSPQLYGRALRLRKLLAGG